MSGAMTMTDVADGWEVLRDRCLRSLSRAGVSETELIRYLKAHGHIDEGVRDMDEACNYFHDRITALVPKMPAVIDAILKEREVGR